MEARIREHASWRVSCALGSSIHHRHVELSRVVYCRSIHITAFTVAPSSFLKAQLF